jgi:hypothetical protein
MDDLVCVFLIALGCLARTKKREEAVIHARTYEVRDSEVTVAEAKVTFVRLGVVLDSVACEVDSMR